MNQPENQSSKKLPAHPSLRHLKLQAKALLQLVRDGDEPSVNRVRTFCNKNKFRLYDVRQVLAKEYGFPGWNELRQHVESVREEFIPDQKIADDFVNLACIHYSGQDHPQNYEKAKQLLRTYPKLKDFSLAAACCAGNLKKVLAELEASPDVVNQECGPRKCKPLFYCCYSRVDEKGDDTINCAKALLERGARINETLIGLSPYLFTPLTGVFGEGEMGPGSQPRHPQWKRFATFLLEKGADANDGQGVYNRMFQPGEEHLDLLMSFGLTVGDPINWGESKSGKAEILR